MAMVIPTERKPGEYTLDFHYSSSKKWTDVYLLPSNDRLREAQIDLDKVHVSPERLMTFDHVTERFAIYPFYTRPEPDGTFSPKKVPFKTIWFDWPYPEEEVDEGTVESALGWYSDVFTVDPDFGLGIKQGYRHIQAAAAEFAECEVLYIGSGEALEGQFALPIGTMRVLQREIDRIDRRAKDAENEVKLTTAHNVLAMMVGDQPRPFRLGRNEIRNLIQKYAADPNFTDPSVQEELVLKVAEAASTFAERNPEAADGLVSNLQLSRLEMAIREFESLMGQNHNENTWQRFFEADPFLLTFAFGYPISFVNGQSYVGGRRIDGKGEKIADFLYKNTLNNNAALIEIKKPQTLLWKNYRVDVHGPHEELSGGITQVLDQRYRFASNFAQHRNDNEWYGEDEVADFEIDCILVAGTMPTDKAQRKSFQLYRKNSHGVKVVTFDEMLEQLKQVLVYLRDDSGGPNA